MAQDNMLRESKFRSAFAAAPLKHDTIDVAIVRWENPIVCDLTVCSKPDLCVYDETPSTFVLNIDPRNESDAYALMRQLKDIGVEHFVFCTGEDLFEMHALSVGIAWNLRGASMLPQALKIWFLGSLPCRLDAADVRCSLPESPRTKGDVVFFNRQNGRMLVVDIAKLSCVLFGTERVMGVVDMSCTTHGKNGDKIPVDAMQVFRQFASLALSQLLADMLVRAYGGKLKRSFKRSEQFRRYAALCYRCGSYAFGGWEVNHVWSVSRGAPHFEVFHKFCGVGRFVEDDAYAALLARLKAVLADRLGAASEYYKSEERDAKTMEDYRACIEANHERAKKNGVRYGEKLLARRQARMTILADIAGWMAASGLQEDADGERSEASSAVSLASNEVMRRDGDTISYDNTESHVYTDDGSIYSH